MLRVSGGQVESLFDLGLPVEVRELPADLAALDGLLADPALFEPVERAWDEGARGHGRRAIPMSQAGFDGDLDSRILSSGEETLRRHGPSKEVPARAA